MNNLKIAFRAACFIGIIACVSCKKAKDYSNSIVGKWSITTDTTYHYNSINGNLQLVKWPAVLENQNSFEFKVDGTCRFYVQDLANGTGTYTYQNEILNFKAFSMGSAAPNCTFRVTVLSAHDLKLEETSSAGNAVPDVRITTYVR